MKILGLFVMPFMVISLLVSCGGNNAPQTVEHFVSFNSKGGDYVKTQRVKDKGTVSEPDPVPKKMDYTFDGWYTDEEAVEYKYDFSRPVVTDLTLYAKWKANEYTVIFDANGGTYAETKSGIVTRTNVPCCTMPDIPDDPIKIDSSGIKGYIFTGYDKNVVPVTGDATTITYTAQWKETTNVYTLNVTATNEGTFPDSDIIKNITLAAGSNILNSISYLPNPVFKDTNAVKIFNEYVYENGSEISSSDIVNKDNITIKATYRKKTLEECSWEDISAVSNQGKEFAESYFGPITASAPLNKIVTVNNQPHTVRIIGYGQDVDTSNNPIGITFEFANAISDAYGYSLATYWKNTNTTDGSNSDYTNSSVRKALTNEGNGDLNWFEKDSKSFSSNFANKSVLDMLPDDLTKEGILKTVKKTVNVNTGSASEPIWTPTEFNDKLFLLNPKELGDSTSSAEDSTTYTFYEGTESGTRIKAQINGADGARTTGLNSEDLAGEYTGGSKYSYAGYHKDPGTRYWVRSPYSTGTDESYRVGYKGDVNGSQVYKYALPIAPAFCI